MRKIVPSKKRIFLFLFVLGLLVWAFKLFQAYLIFSGYNNPPHLNIYPSLFQYIGFSPIAFVFPYSWNLRKGAVSRAIAVVAFFILYGLLYLLIFSWLEWFFSPSEYNYWRGVLFTTQHSSLIILLGYAATGLVMYVLGSVKVEPDEPTRDYLKKISYKSKHKTFVVGVEKIVFVESSDNYVSIHFQDGTYELVRKPLAEIERQLDPSTFQRIHRKYIVNLNEVVSMGVTEGGGTEITLSNGATRNVSRPYRSKIRAAVR